MLFWFSFAAMSWSFVALVGSLWCWSRVRKLLHGASVRSLAQLSTEVAELLSMSESLAAQQRRLSSRVGMREVRERRAEKAEGSSTSVGERQMDRAQLKEIARARGLIK